MQVNKDQKNQLENELERAKEQADRVQKVDINR